MTTKHVYRRVQATSTMILRASLRNVLMNTTGKQQAPQRTVLTVRTKNLLRGIVAPSVTSTGVSGMCIRASRTGRRNSTQTRFIRRSQVTNTTISIDTTNKKTSICFNDLV